MRRIDPTTVKIVMLVSAFIPVVLWLCQLFVPSDFLPSGGFVITGILLGAFVALHVSHWASQLCLESESEPPAVISATPVTQAREIPRPQLREWRHDLDSFHEIDRRWAVQGLADTGRTPVAGIRCWPEKKCTDLQLAAAEAMIHEWLEYTDAHPEATEPEIIAAIFPLEEIETERNQVAPRVRRLKQKEPPPPHPLVRTLDHWSEKVKDAFMDLDVAPEENELAGSEGEDCPLGPLDRDRFEQRMRGKLEEAWQHLTETLAAARTDYELVCAEKEIHPLLSTLRWEAIAAALEIRDPYAEHPSAGELQQLAESLPAPSHGPHAAPKPTGDWAAKYRRLRAAGF